MRFKLPNSSIMLGYFLTHLLIYSIPLVIMGVIMYNNAVVNLKHEVEATSIARLAQLKETTDMRMKELGSIAAQISFDSSLTPFMLKHDPLQSMAAKGELARYQALSALVEDIFLYYWDENVIYSPAGTFDLDTMASSYFRLGPDERDKLIAELTDLRVPVIKPAQEVSINFDPQRMIMYWFPIKEISPYGTVMFLIRESQLTGLIDNVWADFGGSAYIMDDERRVVASQFKDTQLEPENWHDFMNEYPEEGIYEAKLGGEKVSVMLVKSELTNWTFVMMLPTKQFMSRVIEMETFLLIVMLILGCTGIGTAVFMAGLQYRPIRNLTDRARQFMPQQPEQARNEFELIHHSMDSALSRNRSLQERVEAQLPIVRERALLQLLKGDAGEWQALLQPGEADSSDLPHVVLLVRASGLQETLQHIGEQFELQGGAIGYAAELMSDHVTAVLVRLASPVAADPGEASAAVAGELRSRLAGAGVAATIAVGLPCASVRQVNRSYIEASAAMEFRLKIGQSSIIYFADVQALQHGTQWYPPEDRLRLVQSLRQGDRMVAQEALEEILGAIENRQQSISMVKCMCFDMINTMLKVLGELRLQESPERVKALVGFETIDDLRQQLMRLADEVCDHVQRERNVRQHQLQDEWLNYISERYTSSAFSLEEMADRFQLSISYLSRAIKDLCGLTFSEYVAGLRLADIKRQLVETKLPIKDVIASAGYIDVSTFMRKFKKHEGVTPGEYRKMYTEAEKEEAG